ncbi:DeoR/GlpR family DNA-binding transcription regulator [uncultured Microbacterium sp.]|uniref:DeoR/GlpR family DNA-binding transcription regulator n=1 Tax=uncultured Microbacterium sp. TaxID=191216 RepID=UPI0035CBB498
MLAAERRRKIADLVSSAGAVSTEDLATRLDVSAETIRRDLLALEEDGRIARVHGGATVTTRSEVSFEPSFDVRSAVSPERKQRIAQTAAALVPPGGLVMIDVGTTALLAARALPASLSATVVTTSVRVAVELADRRDLEVIVVGGRLRSGDLAVSGVSAVDFIAGTHFDVALVGSGGLHATAGLTDYYRDEAETRRTVLSNSSTSYVLCDATKFGVIARYRAASLGDFTAVIVDEAPTGDLRHRLDASGTRVIVAD